METEASSRLTSTLCRENDIYRGDEDSAAQPRKFFDDTCHMGEGEDTCQLRPTLVSEFKPVGSETPKKNPGTLARVDPH